VIAARSRAFIAGSGRPILAATVISRLSLEKSAERFLSCAPLRCMMFLNLEWPAMGGPVVPLRAISSRMDSSGDSEIAARKNLERPGR
jgi:hypothetical protein